MDILSIIRLVGGLALFIYGMTTMSGGLERAAGAKLERILEKMTGTVFRALLMGIAVTAVIQSSSATTVMVVGFVNAGIMNLKQCVGVILGANIGTTVTSQLLRLGSGDAGSSIIMSVLKPSNLCYILVFIGVIVIVTAGNNKTKRNIGDILIGFGVLFIGMATMEGALTPLRDIPEFQQLFTRFSNPVMGVLVGVIVTAAVQSSSASIGILQALSTTGMISYSAAIPIILGQNIGTCVTALLSSIGATKNARRASMIHLYFNFLGTLLFLIGVYAYQSFIGFSFWDSAIDKGGIANFHLIFNLVATLIFIPLNGVLVKLAELTIKDEVEEKSPLAPLDPRFYKTPTVALEQSHRCIGSMASAAQTNFNLVSAALLDKNAPLDEEAFNKNEEFIDVAEVEIGKYLMGLPSSQMPVGSRHLHTQMLHAITDFEKIGDYCENIYSRLQRFRSDDLSFSPGAHHELQIIIAAVSEMLTKTVEAYQTRSSDIAKSVLPLEDVIDICEGLLKSRHIDRLNQGECQVITGLNFLDFIHDLEKISDHCYNINVYTIQLSEGAEKFDTHSYKESNQELFDKEMAAFSRRYLETLNDPA